MDDDTERMSMGYVVHERLELESMDPPVPDSVS